MSELDQQEIDRQLFKSLIYTFALTAKQQLGSVANPVIGKSDQDLEQVSLTLDTLIVLRKKTQGNLLEAESEYLDKTINEIQGALTKALKNRLKHE